MLKILYEILVSSWDIVEDPIVNWIIVAFIGPIVYVAAFKLTGKSAFIVNYISPIMSIIHWSLRILIYIILTHILKGLVFVVSIPVSIFNDTEPRLIASIIVLFIVIIVAIVIHIKSNLKNRIFWK